MGLQFEYGNGLMSAEPSDTADAFVPGEAAHDSPRLSRDRDGASAHSRGDWTTL